jgi:hypothetical protein
MNLLEHHIINIHSVKSKVAKNFYAEGVDQEFIIADITVDCHGHVERIKREFMPEDWELAKQQGYFMG